MSGQEGDLVCRRLTAEEVQSSWPLPASDPNAEFEHFHLVCRLRPNVLEPYVLRVDGKDPAETTFVLVGRLEEQTRRGRLAYLRLGRVRLKAWVGIYGGCLGKPSLAQAEAALGHLVGLLSSQAVDVLEFHGLREDASWWEALAKLGSRAPQFYATPWIPHYRLHLEDDPDFLWGRLRSKHRSWLRGRERRLQERFGESLHWQWHREFPDLEGLMRRLETVARQTYQRALGAGFCDDAEHRERFRLFARQGILRIQTLEAEGRILAFWIGLLGQGTFHSSETGYEPRLADLEIGKLVFFKMVENLVREGAGLLDFGLGDADYKQRFADDHYLERDLYLFSRSPRGLLAALLVGGLGRLDSRLNQFVARRGWMNSIKKHWRQRMRRAE